MQCESSMRTTPVLIPLASIWPIMLEFNEHFPMRKEYSIWVFEFRTISSSLRGPSWNHFCLAIGKISFGSRSRIFCSVLGNPWSPNDASLAGVPIGKISSYSLLILIFGSMPALMPVSGFFYDYLSFNGLNLCWLPMRLKGSVHGGGYPCRPETRVVAFVRLAGKAALNLGLGELLCSWGVACCSIPQNSNSLINLISSVWSLKYGQAFLWSLR